MDKAGKEKGVQYIRGLCGEYINGKIYIHALDFNGILEYDVKTDEKKILPGRDKAYDDAFALSTTSILIGDWIYFVHRVADSILKFSVITYTRKEIFAEGNGNAFNPVIMGNQLLLMPQYYAERIPCVDLKTDEVCYLPFSIPANIKSLITQNEEAIFYGDINLNGYIYRGCRFSSYINKYNPQNSISKYIKINGVLGNVRDITYDGNFFWIIMTGCSQILKWEEEQNRILKVIDLQTYFPEQVEITSIKFIREKLYVLIKKSAKIVEIDNMSGTIHIYNPEEIYDFEANGDTVFSQNICKDEKNTLYFIPYDANGILSIDNKGDMRLFKTDVKTQNILDICKKQKLNERMCSKGSFLRVVGEQNNNISDEKNFGEKIWESLQGGTW